MIIKNKERLVRRAEKDRDLSLFVDNFYIRPGEEWGADFSERRLARPGVPFEGCLIGCLAVPDSKQARERWFRHLARHVAVSYAAESQRRLERDFGLCRQLQDCAEFHLMNLPNGTRARLGGFVVSFCKALPEGRDIDDELVRRWMAGRSDYLGERPYRRRDRKAFLDWLRRGAPEPRKVKVHA